jgi:hypothetical protein
VGTVAAGVVIRARARRTLATVVGVVLGLLAIVRSSTWVSSSSSTGRSTRS